MPFEITEMVIGDKIALIGSGGAAHDILCQLIDAWKAEGIDYRGRVVFTEQDDLWQEKEVMNCPVIRQSDFNPATHYAIIAIGSSSVRQRVFYQLPNETRYATIIHPSVVMSDWVEIGEGSVISAHSVLTCNIKIGKHAQINYKSSIAHDFVAGDFFSTAPGASINGNIKVGNRVYIGSNASIRQGVTLVDDVVIGMGSVVLNSITKSGSYARIPAVRLSS